MSNGTVNVELDHYNELRDFRTRMEEGYAYKSTFFHLSKEQIFVGPLKTEFYVTESEVVKEATEKYNEVWDQLQKFAEMTPREFKKWKKSL